MNDIRHTTDILLLIILTYDAISIAYQLVNRFRTKQPKEDKSSIY